MERRTLDRSLDYGTASPGAGYLYEQDGVKFDADGLEVEPPTPVDPKSAPTHEQGLAMLGEIRRLLADLSDAEEARDKALTEAEALRKDLDDANARIAELTTPTDPPVPPADGNTKPIDQE